jgi:hypothetical protein
MVCGQGKKITRQKIEPGKPRCPHIINNTCIYQLYFAHVLADIYVFGDTAENTHITTLLLSPHEYTVSEPVIII